MARIELKLKIVRRWWVVPVISCAAVWYWVIGRDEIAPAFIKWLARHGLTIEVSD